MPNLTYLSHSAFLLEGAGTRIMIDPFLSGNPVATNSVDQISCDYVIVTHGHGDHLGDAVQIAKQCNATVISNHEIATWCQQQGVQAHPLHIGGGHDFPFGRVKLTIAHHGSGLQTEDGFLYMGNPVGALITLEGKTLYHAGDTGLFFDMKLLGEMHPIDLALLPIGDNFTMGIDDAVKASELLKPKLTIPMHFDTFEVIKADPHEFAGKVQEKGIECKVLGVGESWPF